MKPLAKQGHRLAAAVVVTGLMTGTVLISAGNEAGAKSGVPKLYTGGAGYQETSTTTPPSSVTAQTTVPAVSACTSTQQYAFGEVQVGQQPGSDFVDIGVQFGCDNGSAKYLALSQFQASVFVLPIAINGGDRLTLSASTTSSKSSVTITDNTSGGTATHSWQGFASNYAFVGVDPILNGTSLWPIPKFSPMSFTGAKADGANLSSFTASTGLSEYIQTTNGSPPPSGKIQMLPSALKKSSSFAVKWKHS